MAMNRVQFQKGLSISEFLKQYGRMEQCHAARLASRWPEGFVCPHCGDASLLPIHRACQLSQISFPSNFLPYDS
ncbi:transposase [Candidatus Nitrotoga sp. BS]|uniref:transposase n=1 Tax=Candidatus Nitrotoga sp. BS TaxID=2890408 RepID=UPI00403D9F05